MADVRILPDILTNKIAAGEVVERPVSVVKELVENALDAGATRIVAEIERGGRDLIRISDNGSGMSRDNALLAIERYATSKIFTDEDLFFIKTFGFRGEALPSMAAVSRFTLTTREPAGHEGTRIRIHGGRMIDVQAAGAPPGTMVEVAQLYYNTPARRKFLKGVSTEMGHISDVFSGMALGNPGVGFRLMHNSRLVKAFSSSATLETRAGEVLGMAALENLKRVELVADEIAITGFLSDPVDPLFTRSTARNLRLFVNNRLVNDRGLVAAIFQGYRGRLMKGRYPLGLVFVTLPPDGVDVNVHPSKLEVRFSDQRRIFSLVVRAVREAFLNPYRGKAPVASQVKEPTGTHRVDRSLFQWGTPDKDRASLSAQVPKPEPLFSESPLPDFPLSNSAVPDSIVPESTVPDSTVPDSTVSDLSLNEPKRSLIKPDVSLERDPVVPAKQRQQGKPDPIIVGQVFGTYIVVEDNGEMILVDQHAAHERIVYEGLKKRSGNHRPPSQNLVVPETLELTYGEADLLETILPDLAAIGMEIEPFGGTAFIVKSIPAIIDHRDVRPLVLDIVANLVESGGDAAGETGQWLDECLILMACHTAIRANKTLNLSEMKALVLALDGCENPDHCPHGRPSGSGGTSMNWNGCLKGSYDPQPLKEFS